MNKIPLKTKVILSAGGLYYVLKRPKYIGLAIVLSVVFFEFIFWFNNLPLLQYIITVSSLTPLAKLEFIISTYTSVWQATSSLIATSLIILSFIQGCVLSILIFVIRRNRKGSTAIKAAGGSSLASAFAILGLGCAACGTSLITPLLGIFISNVSVKLVDAVGIVAAILGIAVSLYALYSVGIKAKNTSAMSDS